MPGVPGSGAERNDDLQSFEGFFQHLVDAGHAFHHPLAGALQQLSKAAEGVGQQWNTGEGQQGQSPVQPQRHAGARQNLERFPDQFAPEQVNAGGQLLGVVRESRHQSAGPFGGERLVIERENLPQQFLPDVHQRPFGHIANEHILQIDEHTFERRGRDEESDQQCKALEGIDGRPRQDHPLDPAHAIADALSVGQLCLIVEALLFQLDDPRIGVRDLGLLEPGELLIELGQIRGALLNLGRRIVNLLRHVLMRRLLREDVQDRERRKEIEPPQRGHKDAKHHRPRQLALLRPDEGKQASNGVHGSVRTAP